MAIVLMEEVLVGLDEVKVSVEQAVAMLADIIEEMRPEIGADLRQVLAETLLHPLQSRVVALEALLEALAA
jgi:hypothetical protein